MKPLTDRALRDLVERLQAELARVRQDRDRMATRLEDLEAKSDRLGKELASERGRASEAEQTFRHLLDRLARSHRERQALVAELKRTYGKGRPKGKTAGRRTPGDPTLLDLVLEWLGAL